MYVLMPFRYNGLKNAIEAFFSLENARSKGGVWYTHSNTHFQFVNNMTRISIYFSPTGTYFQTTKHMFSNTYTKHPQSFRNQMTKYAKISR